MRKEIFIDSRHDYTLEVKDNEYLLYYSEDEAWSFPNKLVMKIVDDGNGFKITQRRKNRIDYDEAIELTILFKVIYLLRGEKFEMVESKIEL